MDYQKAPSDEKKSSSWKTTLRPSSLDMVVYAYDEESNRYLPYEIENARLDSNYPTKEIEKVFDDIQKNTEKPPKVRRVLIGRL